MYLKLIYHQNIHTMLLVDQETVKVTDFDDRVDILPVADPNIFSQTQRISMAQTQLQLAQSNPQIHNLYQAYRSMYEAIGVKNINAILPAPTQPTPMDPAMEHIQALGANHFKLFLVRITEHTSMRT